MRARIFHVRLFEGALKWAPVLFHGYIRCTTERSSQQKSIRSWIMASTRLLVSNDHKHTLTRFIVEFQVRKRSLIDWVMGQTMARYLHAIICKNACCQSKISKEYLSSIRRLNRLEMIAASLSEYSCTSFQLSIDGVRNVNR